MPADRFEQRGLRTHLHGLAEILHFKNGFLGIPHQPENDRHYVDGHSVAREGGFRRDIGDADALVDIAADLFDQRHDEVEAGPSHASVAPEPEHGGALPLIRHFDGEQQIEAD